MAGDPKRSGKAFLKNLQGFASLCKKKSDYKLFTDFIQSIPTLDSLKNTKKNTNEKTYSCRKCKKNFKSKRGQARHEKACGKNQQSTNNSGSESAKQTDSASTQENREGSEENSTKTQNENKAKNDLKSRMQKCMFCKKERVRIYDHYLVSHKLDYNLWTRNLTENSQRNGTTCPQCNNDFMSTRLLRKHLTEYHKINLREN